VYKVHTKDKSDILRPYLVGKNERVLTNIVTILQ